MADFVDQVTTMCQAQAPYSYLTLAFGAVYLLTLMAMMRPREDQELFVVIRREIQGPLFEPEAPPVVSRKTAVSLWFERRIQAFLKLFRTA